MSLKDLSFGKGLNLDESMEFICLMNTCSNNTKCFYWYCLGIHGEHSESEGGVYDLSNKRRLGLTEYEAVKQMMEGVLAIKEKEEELAAAKK